MPLYSDAAMDVSLQHMLDNIDRMYLCSAEPTTFLEASSTFRLGVKENPTFTGPANGAVDGRTITIVSFTDGVWEVTGDATHYAFVDEIGGVLLAVEALSTAPEAGTALDSWTANSIKLTLRDPA